MGYGIRRTPYLRDDVQGSATREGRGSSTLGLGDGDIGTLTEASGINCWGDGLGQEGIGDLYV